MKMHTDFFKYVDNCFTGNYFVENKLFLFSVLSKVTNTAGPTSSDKRLEDIHLITKHY